MKLLRKKNITMTTMTVDEYLAWKEVRPRNKHQPIALRWSARSPLARRSLAPASFVGKLVEDGGSYNLRVNYDDNTVYIRDYW